MVDAFPDFATWLARSRAVLDRLDVAVLGPPLAGAVAASAVALKAGKPLLVCGNGGSAADAMHIEGELVGRFLRERPGYRVMALGANGATTTAWGNDYAFETLFSRQTEAWGAPGGALLGISTSGNSANVVAAFGTARAMGMTTIALTGQGGGRLAALADHLLAVPETQTALVQQAHIVLYHWFCGALEGALAG